MPIVIGAKPESDFADPIGMLADCHRRVERFLSVLVRLALEARGGALTSEQRTALETALQYFRDAAPKHTADEEESLFPRVRGIDSPEARAVLRCVESLEGDHARAQESHQEVERLGRAWLTSGGLSYGDAERFSALVAGLADLYRDHIAIEERELFPAAARLLAEPERKAMGEEMAARRGLGKGTASRTL
ncbi:MAG TPA: hemerythrin domain-containing protein [Bryobacteraceae bacterium]|nr:hemerythrin domain-containing protein [Bryobacteraceae bacterium]